MRKNKKLIMAMAIILAIATAAAGTTFAWFTANDGKLNHMETGQLTNGDVQIIEVFPEDELRPGDILDKEVKTVNSGSVDALVRISFAEVIQLLANDGATENRAAVWAGPVNTANPEIPQLFNEALFAADGAYGTTNGWVNVKDAASDFAAVNGIAAGMDLEIFYKAFTIDDGGPNEDTTYSFVVYGEIGASAVAAPAAGEQDFRKYNGKYQFATATFEVVDGATPGTKELDVSDINFKVFRYADKITNKWAPLLDTSDLIDVTAFTELENALSSAAATNPALPVNGDFLTATTDVTATSSPSWTDLNLGIAVKSPSDPGCTALPAALIGEAMIELYFGKTVKTNLSACGNGDWWYNQNDGYFYYIGKLAPGQATSNLLENVGLNSGAEDKYNNLLYDLIVKMEAIQNIKEAVEADNGWDIDTTAGSWGEALVDHLDSVGIKAFAFS